MSDYTKEQVNELRNAIFTSLISDLGEHNASHFGGSVSNDALESLADIATETALSYLI